MEKQRISYIDLYRGIGILIMIMAHVDFGPYFYKFSHSFHMPMFFIVSGLLFNFKPDFLEFVRKKILTLIVPYISFCTLQLIAWLVIHHLDFSLALPHIKSFLYSNTDGNLVGGAMWFLTCLFWAEIIFWIIHKLFFEKTIMMGIICFCAGLFGMVINHIISFRLPYGIDTAFVAVFIMYIGFISKKYIEKIRKLNTIIMIMLFVIGSAAAMINGSINMRANKYSFIPFFLIAMIYISFPLLIMSSKIEDKYDKCFVIKEIEYWGKNSIIYLCLNQFIISICWVFTGENPKIWIKVAILIITMLGLRLTSIIILKTPLILLIGKSFHWRSKNGEN